MNTNSIAVDLPKCDCASAREHELGIAPCCSGSHWSYALAQIRSKICTSTAATVISPSSCLLEYEHKFKRRDNKLAELPVEGSECDLLGPFSYNFNAEPFFAKDIFEYRKYRSEHLLMRMIHCFDKHDFNTSFVRLSKGTFMVQKWAFSEPLVYPSSYTLDSAIQLIGDYPSFPSIDTFTFHDLFNDMMQQTNVPPEKQIQSELQRAESFVPYTHTLGVRFTNPYNNSRDVLVRGHIPLWCQTLLITECLRLLPIAPGTVVSGLLPFARDISFRFETLPGTDGISTKEPYPEVIVIYERFAMELAEPSMMLENKDVHGHKWIDMQNDILTNVLFCDIPDHTAAMITNLANEWAKTQGIPHQ